MLAQRDARRRGHRGLSKLLHVSDAGELAALFFDEGSRAGAARLVHRAVNDAPAGQPGVFRVLPADFKNRVHARVVMQRAGGVRDDFIDDEHRVLAVAGREQRAGDFASAPGGAKRDDRILRRRIFREAPEQILCGANRVAQRLAIPFPDRFLGCQIQRDGFGAGGADVEAEDEAAKHAVHFRPRLLRHPADAVERIREGGQAFQLQFARRQQQVFRRGRRGWIFRRDERAAERFEAEQLFFIRRHQFHSLLREAFAKNPADARRPADAAGEQHARRADAGLE